MNAVLPHLRLLTVPVNHFDQLSKYLSTSQKSFLAARLIFKDETSAANVSPSINLSTKTRNQPGSRNMIIYLLQYKERFDNTKMALYVKATDTLKILKAKIEKVCPATPIDNWRLICYGRRLHDDSKTLADLNIKRKARILLIPLLWDDWLW